MPRLAEKDSKRSDDIAVALRTMTVGGPSALEELVSPLRELLDAEYSGAYGLRCEESGVRLDFLHASLGAPLWRSTLARSLEARPHDSVLYEPARPQPAQRNVALHLAGLQRVTGKPGTPLLEVLRQNGLHDQLRVLVCDGPALLAWVGGFRRDPFGDRERLLLQQLVPALRARLVLEAELSSAPLAFGALAAALEALGAAAFVVRNDATPVHANSAGIALLERDRRLVGSMLQESLAGRGGHGFRLTRISARGVPDHWLAVQEGGPTDLGPRLARAALRYGLTRRQVEVLGLLARGKANKVIAAALGCVEGTVELHVTQILHKTGCRSRAELVARFWMSGG